MAVRQQPAQGSQGGRSGQLVQQLRRGWHQLQGRQARVHAPDHLSQALHSLHIAREKAFWTCHAQARPFMACTSEVMCANHRLYCWMIEYNIAE